MKYQFKVKAFVFSQSDIKYEFSFLLFVSEKPKIGLRATSGTALGFIFTDLSESIDQFRTKINAEVKYR